MAITQANRPLKVMTPLGEDALIVTAFSAREGISQLFQYHLELVADNDREVPFEKLLGQKVTVELAQMGQPSRFFSGMVSRVGQGTRDGDVTTYRAEVVPHLWFLTRKWQSRIFQHLTVPDILKKVLAGIDSTFELTGKFEPRDYCAQYRETDFNFASRLMEEEGIYYFFKHTADGHKMVLANTPQSHSDVPGPSTIHFDETSGGVRPDLRIYSWTKNQEVRAGKYTLFDHSFELPHKHLEAERPIQDKVRVGTVTHLLNPGGNGQLEIYDFPGEYAQRFDGIDKGGGERPAELQKIFQDNKRTVSIRMQQEAVSSIEISGASNCPQLVSGHKFTIDRHFNANGSYVLTSVRHVARQTSYTSGMEDFLYSNTFTCIPTDLPFRPSRGSPRPVVQGTQTAVVVGPPGQEIFTDKFGRVKVQFHWDRDGKSDVDSSCWLRVGQLWAGKRWGASFWPRIGQEVIVDFLEGDPDQPIIIGSVYNADQMPPYLGDGLDSKHKNDPKVSGIKTSSTPGGKGFNELRFDDTKDKEQVFIHAQRNMDTRVKKDGMEDVGGSRNLTVGGDQNEQVGGGTNLTVKKDHVEKIEGNMLLLVGDQGGNQDIIIKKTKKELIEGENHLHVKKARNEKIDGTASLTIDGDQQEKVGKKHALDAGEEIHLKAGQKVVIEAGMELTLVQGANFIKLDASGVTIFGAPMTLINGGGEPGQGSGSQPTAPEDAAEAKPAEPAAADDSASGVKSAPG